MIFYYTLAQLYMQAPTYQSHQKKSVTETLKANIIEDFYANKSNVISV